MSERNTRLFQKNPIALHVSVNLTFSISTVVRRDTYHTRAGIHDVGLKTITNLIATSRLLFIDENWRSSKKLSYSSICISHNDDAFVFGAHDDWLRLHGPLTPRLSRRRGLSDHQDPGQREGGSERASKALFDL